MFGSSLGWHAKARSFGCTTGLETSNKSSFFRMLSPLAVNAHQIPQDPRPAPTSLDPCHTESRARNQYNSHTLKNVMRCVLQWLVMVHKPSSGMNRQIKTGSPMPPSLADPPSVLQIILHHCSNFHQKSFDDSHLLTCSAPV